MLSELAIYYPDDDDDIPIQPFVVAPIFQQQDSLIIAPQTIAHVHDDFMNRIYSTIPNTNLPSIYSRVFDYKSFISIIVVFPTNVKEDKTNRPGLLLALGALIEKRIFIEHIKPASSYFSLFFSQFNKIFEIDLFNHGASQVVDWLKQEKHYPMLRDKFSLLLDLLLNAIFLIRRKRGLFSSVRFNFRRKHTTFPRMILYVHELNAQELLHIFLSEIDEYLNRGTTRIDIATHSFENEASTIFVKLDYLSKDIDKVELKVLKKKKYISVH